MDVNLKPYKTGMVTVKEKYPCGRGDSKGRNHVYYLCQCDCGKEFIVTGDELSRHPYSCGCTPKPIKGKGRLNDWALGYDEKEHTMLCMIRPTRAIYANASSGVSGVNWEPRRKRWRAKITVKRKTIFLGYFKKKEDAIKARIEGEMPFPFPAILGSYPRVLGSVILL